MKKPHMKSVESLTKVPLLELAGHSRVLIENHLGVLAYSLEEIQIKVSYGRLVIHGEQLMLLQMSKEQLVITGRIDSVQLIRR